MEGDIVKLAWSLLPLLLAMATGASAQNEPPAAPVILEPALDGQVVHPADVHMATAPLVDPDPGDAHRCSEFEIWRETPPERVWSTPCLEGAGRVHAHLGDGVFEGSLTGRLELDGSAAYRLRARHVDSSGDPVTEAGPFAERTFETSTASVLLPLELDDVLETPGPRWLGRNGLGFVLPNGSALRIETPDGALLLAVLGRDSLVRLLLEPPALPAHAPLRVVIEAPPLAPLTLPLSRLSLTGGDGVGRTLYLPALALAAGESRAFWISTNGSSFVAESNETTPDFSELAQSVDVPWSARPGFSVEVAARGFQLPVNIAFVPEPGPEPDAPLYYVSELHSGIRVVLRDGSVHEYAVGLLNFDPLASFPGAGEQGVTGVAVEPVTGDVFASFLYADPPGAGAPHYPIVVRIPSADGGRTGTLPPVPVLDMFGETQSESHQVSNLSFGPDGMLTVHVGDGFFPATARDLASFRGKILRVHPSGLAPEDNPFYDASDGITARDYVFAYGFRNPFGGAWRGADGAHYSVENGPFIDRFARIDAGADYGWTGFDADMLVRAIYNWAPATAPVNLAWVQPGTFGGSDFPEALWDRAYVSESGPTWASGPSELGKRISEFVVSEAGALVSGPTPLVEYSGAGKATVAALAAGPDGLYFSDLYKDVGYDSPIDRGANVLRVRFVGEVAFSADVGEGAPPLRVRFHDASTVPEASAWRWSFGDGATSTERHPEHVYAAPGRYDVSLEVTGRDGVRSLERARFVRVSANQTDLFVSESPLRSRGELLDGRTLTENADVFVFLDPPERATQVRFSLDGVFGRTDLLAPFDLLGSSGTLARPLAVGALEDGEHTVTAEVTLAGGGSETLVAGFTVALPACGPGSRVPELPPALACDDGDGCTDDVCDAGRCLRLPVDFAAVDDSFESALVAPLCAEDPSIERRLWQARKRVARAESKRDARGARLVARALEKLEEARERSLLPGHDAACAAEVAAALGALTPRAECLAP